MIIEILYPEHANLFGDMSNMRYLQACLPDAEFLRTPMTEVPYFVNHKVDLLYMGPMTERTQQRAILALMPFADRIKEMIQDGTPMLFTGNAMEVLGHNIHLESGNSIHGLGILPMNAKQDMFHRYNGLVLGHFSPIEADIVGFKSQFTSATGENADCAFVKVERGIGLNKQSKYEGFFMGNMIATYLIGPLLILNPALTRWLLDTMGATDAPLAFEEAVTDAYTRRLAEFCDPQVDVE
ncbi:MAG: hypothetical protein E7553_05225 [Ruminococcaceae bacterium]|nr:hypothetical protein [Oscillospiraceae bacterium]